MATPEIKNGTGEDLHRKSDVMGEPVRDPKPKGFSSPDMAATLEVVDGQTDASHVTKPVRRHRRAPVRRMRGVTPRALKEAPNVHCNAASVDANGSAVVAAAHSAAAGTVREACAEVARKAENTRLSRIPSEIVAEAPVERSQHARGRRKRLPEYAGGFTDEVHRYVDLVQVQVALLNSKDEKIKQRSLERLLEMKYGKGAEQVEEAPQIVIDVARPNRIPKKETEEI